MQTIALLNATYLPSQDVIARELEGEIIIVPLTGGIGDMEDELYTLNETGKIIWDKLDGKRSLTDVVVELSTEFDVPGDEVEQDVIGFVEELLKRRILIEVPTV